MVELRVHIDTLGCVIQLMFAPHRGFQGVITDCEQIISSVTSLWSPGASQVLLDVQQEVALTTMK